MRIDIVEIGMTAAGPVNTRHPRRYRRHSGVGCDPVQVGETHGPPHERPQSRVEVVGDDTVPPVRGRSPARCGQSNFPDVHVIQGKVSPPDLLVTLTLPRMVDRPDESPVMETRLLHPRSRPSAHPQVRIDQICEVKPGGASSVRIETLATVRSVARTELAPSPSMDRPPARWIGVVLTKVMSSLPASIEWICSALRLESQTCQVSRRCCPSSRTGSSGSGRTRPLHAELVSRVGAGHGQRVADAANSRSGFLACLDLRGVVNRVGNGALHDEDLGTV